MMNHPQISSRMASQGLTVEHFASCLQPALPALSRAAEAQQLIPAAVILPLLRLEEGWRIVFIRRSDQVQTHRGQIALPGGRREEEDPSDLATALREVQEELGLFSPAIEILGALSPRTTPSGYWIQPYVGHLAADSVFQPEAREVAEVFSVPLDFFLTTPPVWDAWGPAGKTGQGYHYGQRAIWGATAAIVHQFVDLLHAGLRL